VQDVDSTEQYKADPILSHEPRQPLRDHKDGPMARRSGLQGEDSDCRYVLLPCIVDSF